jgi:hypothetical protein
MIMLYGERTRTHFEVECKVIGWSCCTQEIVSKQQFLNLNFMRFKNLLKVYDFKLEGVDLPENHFFG